MKNSKDMQWYTGEIPHEGRLGVIDIGSNSIRLVVYDGIKRMPLPLFNEKIFCRLAKGMAITGKLNPEGVKLVEASMKRFLALLHVMDVVELQVLATAAVRDASDGAAFVENLERKYRVNITVVSGKKEAQLAASGIFSSLYNPEGLAGDLGGGSIELVSIEKDGISNQTTIPIGPLRLLDAGEGNMAKIAKLIEEAIAGETWLDGIHPQSFYAIGGSFRTLAHIHMQKEEYPLDIVHNYAVKTAPMRRLLQEIIHSPVQQLKKMPGASDERIDSLIPAAMVMDRILDITNPVDVVFSASGIREGYLYEKLTPSLRNEDPLIASCMDLASQNGRRAGFARELFAWISPLFEKESDASRRLRFSACILSEIAWLIHQEYRSEWAFSRILHSTLAGLSHPERVTLALALYHRYQFKPKLKSPVLSLVNEKEKVFARLIGTATHLAFLLSGGHAGNLRHVTLSQKRGNIEVTFDQEAQDLLSDSVRKSIHGLNEVFEAFNKLR